MHPYKQIAAIALAAFGGIWLFAFVGGVQHMLDNKQERGLYFCRYLTPSGIDVRVWPEPCR